MVVGQRVRGLFTGRVGVIVAIDRHLKYFSYQVKWDNENGRPEYISKTCVELIKGDIYTYIGEVL